MINDVTICIIHNYCCVCASIVININVIGITFRDVRNCTEGHVLAATVKQPALANSRSAYISRVDMYACVTHDMDMYACVTHDMDMYACVTHDMDMYACVTHDMDMYACVTHDMDMYACVTHDMDMYACVTHDMDMYACVTHDMDMYACVTHDMDMYACVTHDMDMYACVTHDMDMYACVTHDMLVLFTDHWSVLVGKSDSAQVSGRQICQSAGEMRRGNSLTRTPTSFLSIILNMLFKNTVCFYISTRIIKKIGMILEKERKQHLGHFGDVCRQSAPNVSQKRTYDANKIYSIHCN